MAKISQTIAPTMGGTTPKASGVSYADPTAGAVAGAISTGLSLFADYQKREQAAQDNAGLAKVHTSFLEAQDDAILQQQEASAIQNTIAGFYEDDTLSGEEIKMMEGLRNKLSKFDLLTPSQRQLRRNALLKQALNDPANERIYSNISSMFGGMNIEPVMSAEQQATIQAMDTKYGTGNWNAEDVGRERGKATYLQGLQQKASTNLAATLQDSATTAAALADDTVYAIQREFQEKGALGQDFINTYRLQASKVKAQGRKLIYNATKEWGKGLSEDQINKAIKDFDSYFEAVDKIVMGDNNLLDAYSAPKQLEALNKLRDQSIMFHTPHMIKAGVNMINGGASNGATSVLELAERLQKTNMRTLLTEKYGVSADVLDAQAATLIEHMFTGGEKTSNDLARFGNTQLQQVLGANIVLKNANTPEQAKTGVNTVMQPLDDNAPEADIDANFENIVDAIIARYPNIKANNAQENVKIRAMELFNDSFKRNMITPQEMETLHVVDNQIVIPDMVQNGVQNKMLMVMRRDVKALNKLLRNTPDLKAADILRNAKEQMGIGPDARPSGMDTATGIKKETKDTSTVMSRAQERASAGVQAYKEQNPQQVGDDAFIEHMKLREGVVGKSYKDSLGKLTGGIGHLMSKEEAALYPEGTEIPEDVVNKWFEEDSEEALTAAQKQASEAGLENNADFVNALASVNFQLGTNWTSKFPTAWKHIKAGDIDRAIAEIEFTAEGSGVESMWKQQTPVRVQDFVQALRRLK